MLTRIMASLRRNAAGLVVLCEIASHSATLRRRGRSRRERRGAARAGVRAPLRGRAAGLPAAADEWSSGRARQRSGPGWTGRDTISHKLERPTFMMLDRGHRRGQPVERFVGSSRAPDCTTARTSGRRRRGAGFFQPLRPSEHWHFDVASLNLVPRRREDDRFRSPRRPDGKARGVELGGPPMTDEQRRQRGWIGDPNRHLLCGEVLARDQCSVAVGRRHPATLEPVISRPNEPSRSP